MLVADSTLASIIAEHRRFVYTALAKLRVASSDVDDAAQEVFLVVFRRLGEYSEKRKIRAWLFAICFRVAQGFRRKQRRRRESLMASWPDIADELSPHEHLVMARALRLADSLLQLVPEPQRTAFLLYELNDLPMSAAASAMNCPLQTAYSRVNRARDQIAHLVGRVDQGEAAGLRREP